VAIARVGAGGEAAGLVDPAAATAACAQREVVMGSPGIRPYVEGAGAGGAGEA
jgi:hypothetical protein